MFNTIDSLWVKHESLIEETKGHHTDCGCRECRQLNDLLLIGIGDTWLVEQTRLQN